MMESTLKTINSALEWELALYQVLVSFCMVFPLLVVLWEFLWKALPDDISLSMVHFPSSREGTSKYSQASDFHMHISVSEFVIPPIVL